MRNIYYNKPTERLELSVDNTIEANLMIFTYSGVGCLVNWGDGNVQILPSGSEVTHFYATNFTGDVVVTPLGGYLDISRFQSVNSSTAWSFDLGVFAPLAGLISFILHNLPNANITGDSSVFSSYTNLRDFVLLTSPTSNITMNYDDILNIWQSSVFIINIDSGISASKATTSPFNFDSFLGTSIDFQNISLSTQSMDNMIIALDNSLITQTSPKTIYLVGNAPHSGSPAVMTALSNLATKNITVVL